MERRPIIARNKPQSPAEIAIQIEERRRNELRHDFLVPIYVMWTSDVTEEEGRAGLEGVKDVLRASGQKREIINFGSSSWGNGDFSSADWYLEEAVRRGEVRRSLDLGEQLTTGGIGRLFHEEPWQESPHWEVFIINHDLTSGESDNNFVFGETDTRFASSVQSVSRLRRLPRELKLEIIRRLLRHEVGHMFGLPSYGRRNTVDNESSLGNHCTNVCSVRQGLNIDAWIKQFRQEEKLGVQFCGDCLRDLAKSKDRFKPLPTPHL